MKCEICHRAEAETAITVRRDGEERELYVCAACAKAARDGRPGQPPQRRSPRVTIVGGDGGDVPQPIVEEFVKATLGFMKGMAASEEETRRTCPACGTSWERIKKESRIGCPACWKTFAREIRETFLKGEYGPAHVGAAPAVSSLPDPESARTVLERELKDAIAREDYRRAAAIKHDLDALGGGKGDA